MKASVLYCVVWKYKPRAVSLAAELKETIGVVLELIPGERGAFEITVDRNLIFSKLESGRFPEAGEVVKLFKQAE